MWLIGLAGLTVTLNGLVASLTLTSLNTTRLISDICSEPTVKEKSALYFCRTMTCKQLYLLAISNIVDKHFPVVYCCMNGASAINLYKSPLFLLLTWNKPVCRSCHNSKQLIFGGTAYDYCSIAMQTIIGDQGALELFLNYKASFL